MIRIDDLHLTQGSFALRGVSFDVPAGAYAVLTGRTGSGKTTLLETIAGLRRPSRGRVWLGGRDVTDLPPALRGVGYVPQDAAVFRTMTVADNLGFALAIRGNDPTGRVAELAKWLGLTALLGRRADALSGGEAQRVALGRALAARPAVLLLDEPLAALDDETRDGLIGVLEGIRGEGRTTVLHVTHNRDEADRLGGVRLRLSDGRVVPV